MLKASSSDFDASEIELTITAFARSPNGGLIVTGSTLAIVYRELITTLVRRGARNAVEEAN